MKPKYEEKTFESYFNTELDKLSSVYFPFGQVQEGGIGADAGAFTNSRRLWRKLGYPYFFGPRFPGVPLREIADEMEEIAEREINNIPKMKVNLLFQYKRPEVIASSNGSEWGFWNQKYFRYDIYPEQQILLENVVSKFGEKVLAIYASPALEGVDDLVSAKKRGNIINSTNFRPVEQLSGHHRNTYIRAGTHSVACSEPVRLEPFDLLSNIRQRERVGDERNSVFIAKFAKGVTSIALESSSVSGAYRESLREYEEVRLDRYPLVNAFVSMGILRELTGLQWVLA